MFPTQHRPPVRGFRPTFRDNSAFFRMPSTGPAISKILDRLRAGES